MSEIKEGDKVVLTGNPEVHEGYEGEVGTVTDIFYDPVGTGALLYEVNGFWTAGANGLRLATRREKNRK